MAQAAKFSKKESDLFKQVVNCYETKAYQKGVKLADSILKKFPNHGETQAMKGLIMNCLNKKDEAYELVKSGLRNDVRSHICWHVYGLLHRSDNNYAEASKCYLNALRIDKNNQNILRDLSWLQIQMRDYPGFLNTRRQVLDGRSTLRNSWVAFAVANYLNQEYTAAFDVVTKFRDSKVDRGDAYEESEFLLFQNECLVAQKKYSEAIAHLHLHRTHITDKFGADIKEAELLILSGQFPEAQELWMKLVRQQPDNYRFHTGLQTAWLELGEEESRRLLQLQRLELPSSAQALTPAQKEVLRRVYAGPDFPAGGVTKKVCLTLWSAEEPELRPLLEAHIKASLRRGMPALFHDIAALLVVADSVEPTRLVTVRDPVDVGAHPLFQLVMGMIEGFITGLSGSGGFEEGGAVEDPPVLLWTLFLKCNLLELVGDLPGALSAVDACLDHTPTALDMYTKRARLLKKTGDLLGAAVVMDECRALDLQDRYLNNKTTKYYLRANEVEQAMDTIAMFTKHDGDPQKILYDLQCNWYQLEMGEAYGRKKQWGNALQRFYSVKKHFIDYYDDLFDFHGYCARKTTIRGYLDVMAMHEKLYAHKFFQRAARGALEILLHLLDSPEDIDGLGHLPPAERKKERAKLKKKQKKKEEEEKAAADSGEGKKKDEIDGDKLLQKDFTEEALIWCDLLTKSQNVPLCEDGVVALVVNVFMRKNEYLKVVKLLHQKMMPEVTRHPALCLSLVNVAFRVKSNTTGGTGGVKKQSVTGSMSEDHIKEMLTLLRELLSIPGSDLPSLESETVASLKTTQSGLDVTQLVQRLVARAKEDLSLPLMVAAVNCVQVLLTNVKDCGSAGDLLADMFVDAGFWSKVRGINVKNVIEMVKALRQCFPQETFSKTFEAEAVRRYPTATFFEAATVKSSEPAQNPPKDQLKAENNQLFADEDR